MVTSVIGKIFLEAYNEKHNKTYTPKSFFVEVYKGGKTKSTRLLESGEVAKSLCYSRMRAIFSS